MTKVNLGVFNEIATEKADRDLRNVDLTKTDVVIEYQEPTEENGYTWYRLYASGWVEQGGQFTKTNAIGVGHNITLPIKMNDNLYNPTASMMSSNSADGTETFAFDNTQSILIIRCGWTTTGQNCKWQVFGKADMTGHEILPSKKAIDEYDHRVIAFQKPTEENNYTWYRKYADGWVEQGGQHLWNKSCPNRVSITYPIPMASAVNSLFITRPKGIGDVQAYDGDGCESQNATGFISAGLSSGNSAANSFVWQVSGMAAE